MSTLIRAVFASLISLLVVVGPVSAATTQAVTVAQATQTGTVTGTVTGGDTGSGLGSATVLADGAGTHTTVATDSSGTFSFPSLPQGVYTLTITHGGYVSTTATVTVTAGQAVTASVTLNAVSLSNLGVIGRTSSTSSANAAKFNVSSVTTQTLSQSQILARNTPDLSQVLNELPGITIPHATSNPNQSFQIRGLRYETKAELDGHPVSSGTGGTFLTNYTAAPLFGGIDVLKGQGVNGPTSGEAGAGIVNLRTPDFASKDTGFIQGGLDSYGGSFDTILLDLNFLKDNKLSFILGRSFSGYRGPTFGQYEPDYTGASIPASTNMQIPNLTNGTIQYVENFEDTYSLNAELAKMRYKFSDATSIAFEFIGFQGNFNPQGGAYGQFAGYLTVPQCLVGTKASTACNSLSEYGTPAAAGLIGQTVPVYAFYPGSFVKQNQPNFSATFQTSIGNDTLSLRPYTARINRLIDGTQENNIPGDNGGGWYQVTNSANCQVTFVAASAANNGAKGPCYAAGTPPIAAYVTDPNTPHVYNTNSAALVCTVTTPCYTTSTGINNSGQVGFGSPYTTLEVDKLFGYTFQYTHPVGANTFSVAYDHYYDDAIAYVNDASPLLSGCTFTLGAVANTAGLPGSQSTCALPTTRPSPLSVPETFSSVGSLSLTTSLALTSKFTLDFGGYFTHYNIQAQREDPGVLAFYNALLGPSGRTAATPIVLSGITNAYTHFDPHFGLSYRVTRDWNIRANGGSSLSIPYASQVSGFTTAAQGATSTTLTTPNFALAPEEIVSIDLGTDYRTPDGSVVSADIYNTVIHNPWISTKVQFCGSQAACAAAPQLAGLESTQAGYTSQTLNGAQQYAQGFEISIAKLPTMGFGYRVNTSFERLYYLQTPNSFFGGAPQVFFNGNQFVSTGSGQSSVPYAKGYAEVQYAGANKSLIRFGADYEGNMNSYNANAFWIFDAGARINTGFHDIMLGGTVENLFNTNFGALLARGVEFQGLNPIAGTPSATGYTYSQPFNSALVAPTPITFRFTLTKQF